MDVEYEEYFKSTCNCIILDGEIVIYNNVKTLRFNIEAARNGEKFIGYNDSFVSGDILYNVLFLAFEKDFEEHKSEYSNIMNSLMINGKTTIDSYKEYEETR